MQRHLDCIWICNWIRISNIDKDFVLLLVILKWIWPNYSPKQLPWHFNSFYFSIRSIYILIKFSIKWNSKNMVNKYYVLSSLLEMFYFEYLKCLFFIWKVLYATWLTKYEVSLFFFFFVWCNNDWWGGLNTLFWFSHGQCEIHCVVRSI